MAPIRRYLRITKYSVLECRIYLDNPSLAESWLLNTRNPVLPRVIESVRPLVLPKLREENERSKGKGGGKKKKKGVKDVIVEEDFEVSIFLTETGARHSLLTKQKHFREPNKGGIQSNSSKLTGGTNENAIEVEDAPIIREESDDEGLQLHDLPAAIEDTNSDLDDLFVSEDEGPRRSKRPRTAQISMDDESSADSEPSPKRMKDSEDEDVLNEENDNKKKMALNISYEGFSIYGRVLCLVIKRKEKRGMNPVVMGGHAMMEDWIASTQMPPQEDDV